MIDTHCHLTHARFAGDAEEVIARAGAAGVDTCITIGTGVEDAVRALGLARRHPGAVAACAGIDPFSAHAAGDRFDAAFEALEGLLTAGGFVALGEVGLDYHHDLDPPAVQARRLERQLDLARRLNLPVVIHVREAHDDMAAILTANSRNVGVIHSFTGGPQDAERYLALGWLLAFNGVVTFNNAGDVRAAARLVPADRIVIETDSPYLAPNPVRGRRCEPSYVAHTLGALANARGEDVSQLEAATTANARALFGLQR